MSGILEPEVGAPRVRGTRLFRRRPWENIATLVIGAGVLMLMQPFSLGLYGWSFSTTLAGTVMFTIVSKFPN